MRIIYLHPHFTSDGGAGRMVLETGKRLASRGHQVDCVCIRADREIVGADEGISFHEIGGPLSSQVSFWLNFRSSCKRVAETVARLVNQSSTDCVLFPQVFPANWWGSYVLQQMRDLNAVWYCHEPSAFIHAKNWIHALPWPKNWMAKALSPLLSHWDLRACQTFKTVLVNSRYSQKYAQSVYGFSDNQCEVVYLGFDHGKFSPGENQQREQGIVCVAKLTRFKNVDRIIEALLILQQAGDAATRLHIVGTGDAYHSLKQQAARLGLESRVAFHGRLEDTELVGLLQRARGLCLASVDEPFGLVAIEAMACGTPVVAVNSGGPAEIVGSSQAGLLVDRPEPALIASAIRRLLTDSDEFETSSNAAIARAADFDWELTVDKLETALAAPPATGGSFGLLND